MRTIRISDAVWDAISQRGKFGETEDDVLRRVFGVDPATMHDRPARRGRGKMRFASRKMSARVESGKLVVAFDGDARQEWTLGNRTEKAAIRDVLEDALAFALSNGATNPGQTNAVRKALTDAGYYLTK